MTQHTLKVNIAFPVSSRLARSHRSLVSYIPQKYILSHCHEDYRGRLHVRLVNAFFVANWYTEMCSIT